MKILCLLRVQFWAILADMFPVKEKSKLSQKKILSGLMFFALVISLVVYSYCYAIGYALSLVGGTKYMPSMAMAVASLVILCTTILKTKGVLFAFRDYDMVMSLPIETKDVFLAKLMVNWTVLAPILFCSIILWPLFNLNLIMGIIMIGNTILCGLFISVFGLVNNLKRPVFNWTSEAMVVKQSTASMITIFSGMGIALLQGALVMVFNNPFLGYGISFLALGLWTYRLWKKLFSWGVREFTNIAG